MYSRISFILACVAINLIKFNVNAKLDANLLESLVNYNDSTISKFQSIFLNSKDILNLHHAFVFETMKWFGGQIGFQIDPNFDEYEIDNILAAMYEIERASCIRFAAFNASESPGYPYLAINKVHDNRFESTPIVGFVRWGKQSLQLSVDMVNEHTTILRELLHTIGFNNHHQRSDRDKYIAINLENTDLSDLHILKNYAKEIKFDPLVKYITPFDFKSVMLYDETEFSINNKSVVTSKIKGKRIPTSRDRQRGLSTFDKILLNRFYNCQTTKKKKSDIFYENDIEMAHPMVVNYHEIQRAKHYFENSPEENVEESQTSKQLNGENGDLDDVNNKYPGYRIRIRCCKLSLFKNER